MQLNDVLHESFPKLVLRPSLFYRWAIGIRFELGVEWKREYEGPDNPYIRGCYHRAITLFEATHAPSDELFVIMDVNDFSKGKNVETPT